MPFTSLEAKEQFAAPFRYFVAPKALSTELSSSLLGWLETSAPWKLVEADFYEQYEFSLRDVALPGEIGASLSSENIATLRRVVESAFDVRLREEHDATVHKLVPGQRIRIHNDFIPGHETHRVLVQLNRGWGDENGGALIFFNSTEASDIHKVFRPVHNSCVAFEISRKSLHAVSTIHSGERFTLVFSFYREDE